LERVLELKQVVVTGGVASGKSTVCQFLNDLGAYVVSADDIVHHLLTPDSPIGQQVIKLLGSQVVVEDHFDRAKIAQDVFSHRAHLEELEQILHPPLRQAIEQHVQIAKQQGAPLFVAEIPLYFESKAPFSFEIVVVVQAPEDACRKRWTGHDFTARQSRLFLNEEKLQRADVVLTNASTLQDLKKHVQTLYQSLTQE